MSDESVTVVTPEGERITYRRVLNTYYWEAMQEGMPDTWRLSRVASRAVDEIIRLRDMTRCPACLEADIAATRPTGEDQ